MDLDLLRQEIQRQEDRYEDPSTGNTSALSKAIQEVTESSEDAVGPLEYIRAKWGLEESPYPIQAAIIKIFFGHPLLDEADPFYEENYSEDDNNPRDGLIHLYNDDRTEIEYSLTESQFLDHLYKTGRCNVSLEEYKANPDQIRTKVVLRLGRRSTKTSLSQWVTAYECYRLLRKYSPQKYYRMRHDNPIRITLIATGKEQAQDLLAPARAAIKRSPALKRFVRGDSKGQIEMVTSKNIDDGVGAESGIILQAAPCSARSLRGPANLLALLEEFGAFFKDLAGSNKSDKEIWTALEPSTADYMDPVTGAQAGRMFIISTPMSKESYMYVIEKAIWDGDIQNGLVLHMPTWWMNPLVGTEALQNAKNVDPEGFNQEYGALYSEVQAAAFTMERLEEIRVDPEPNWNRLREGEQCVMGVDLGLTHDATVIIVCAIGREGIARVVHYESHQVGKGEYVNDEYLDIQKMAQRVDAVWRYWKCRKGFADQWNSYGLQSHLKSGARKKLEFKEYTQKSNDTLARSFIEGVNTQKIQIMAPEEDFGDIGSSNLLRELLLLERVESAGVPPKVRLQAPQRAGFHDDAYSALSRAYYAAMGLIDQVSIGNSSQDKVRDRMVKERNRQNKAMLDARLSNRKRLMLRRGGR